MTNYLSTFIYTNCMCIKDNQNYNKILELNWLSPILI